MAKFKTRARTVDMLGRQQIAGIPTAISELFKNAHDAYADRAEVDYYRNDRLFVLRDDGLGMTREDFEQRWLTLGTESKLAAQLTLAPPPIDATKITRAILGEKGIGRLAIAAIGPQVLILTRAEREARLKDIVVAYIHWGLFELPGVDLDEIEIPLQVLPQGSVPSRKALGEMIGAVEANLKQLGDRVSPTARSRILGDISRMRSVDPVEVESYVPELDLSSKRGTHFIIIPADGVLEADLDTSSDPEEASSLEKLLLGFSNSMTPNHPLPVITTSFRDHLTAEASDDLVQEDRFFSPVEFSNADHYISGEFDRFGQFRGGVSVYGERNDDYVVAWPGARGNASACGPFEIHLAAIQPNLRETTLPPGEHALLLRKTRRFGGLYIYRDGIRVLPYGDVDYDWLEIEKRRTKGAAYYYFSHRNVFGAILLSHAENFALTEKAGREGFRENTAYRQLRDILKNFLVQVAGDFFRDEGAYADHFQQQRDELTRQHRALEKRKGLVAERKRALREALEKFFESYDADEPSSRALELAKSVEADLSSAQSIAEPQRAATFLLTVESKARAHLRELEDSYRVTRPRGVGLGRLLREYQNYEAAYAQLQAEVFSEVRKLIEGDVTAAAERARVELDRRLRVERALGDLADTATRVTKSERSETQNALDRVRREVRDAARERQVAVEETVRSTLAEFASTDVKELTDESLIALRDTLERQILDVQDRSASFLSYVRGQLEAIDLSGELDQLDQMEALEQRTLDLEQRAEYDLQLAQLGMAVDVINHEFDASVRSIRTNLRRLHAWADLNKGLEGLYQDLRTSFEHLDGYLTLFTPLHRRLNRTKTTFSGADIERYLRDLFGPRFERHRVTLRSTARFRGWTVTAYPSSFYPVFVNLVDNATFWLDRVTTERIIELDTDSEAIYVSNTGESIPARRWEVIFDQGVSFKPGGRGLGLYISREVLKGVEYSLTVMEPRPGMQVTFRIEPQEATEL